MTDTMTPMPEEPKTSAPEEVEASVPSSETPLMEPMAPGAEGHAEIPSAPGQPTKHTGKEGEIEKVANDYVIPISEASVAEWSKAGPEEFKKYAEQVAIGMYPTFAPQIQAGLPVRVLLDPYVQVAQQILGSIMSQPNWTDPKWSAALQGGTDSKTGRPIPMTLDQWRQYLMQHPSHGWDKSPQAMDRAGQFSQILNQAFTTPRTA